MRISLVILLSLPLALVAFQQPAPELTKPASIEGRVIDARSGEPLRKALVILRPNNSRGAGAYTDAAGKFSFQPVEPGSYTLSAEHDSYVPDPSAKPTIVNLNAGDSASGVVLKLLATGAISGRIFDADGDPVMGASVDIQMATARKGGNSFLASAAASNDRGEYRAFNLPPGKYRISASYSRSLRQPNTNLQRAADLSGAPSEEVYAITYYPSTVKSTDAAIVTVDPAADLHGFDLQLRRLRAVRVRGTVTSPQGAEGFAAISLRPVAAVSQAIDAFVIATDGKFVLGGVLPGRYILSAETALRQSRLSTRRTIDVGDNGLDGIQLTLIAPQKLDGRIQLPEGRKLSGVMVTLVSREVHDHQAGGMAQPESDGSFIMPDVASGDYDVALASTGPTDDLYVARVRMGDSDALTEGIHVADTALPKLEITMKANGGALECSVTNDNRDPVPDAQVTLVPDPPRQSQIAIFGDCRTDASGSCTITGVAPGDYHLVAFESDPQRNFRDPETLKEFQKFTKSIKVAEGDRQKIELKAVPQEN